MYAKTYYMLPPYCNCHVGTVTVRSILYLQYIYIRNMPSAVSIYQCIYIRSVLLAVPINAVAVLLQYIFESYFEEYYEIL